MNIAKFSNLVGNLISFPRAKFKANIADGQRDINAVCIYSRRFIPPTRLKLRYLIAIDGAVMNEVNDRPVGKPQE
jgi:hypothetical protein